MLTARTQFELRPARLVGRSSAFRRGDRAVDRGAAAVEMALVLPLLLLFMFGIIDFGRMFNKQISVTAAAQDGARFASFGIDPTARAKDIAGNVAVEELILCPSASGDAQLTLSYEFQFVTPVGFIGTGFGGVTTLTGRGAMPCQ